MKAVPTDLEALFREILERDQDRDGRLRASIQWVLYTIVPLSCEELYSAIMISTDTTEAEWTGFDTGLEDPFSDSPDSGWMEDMILSSSRGLVEISDRGESVDFIGQGLEEEMSRRIAQFIHESVKDYFFKGGLRHLDESLSQNPMAISYERLAYWCHGYLKLAPTEDSVKHEQSVDLADRIAAKCKSWPLLQYAADNMLVYASKATEIGYPLACTSPNLSCTPGSSYGRKVRNRERLHAIHYDPCARCYTYYAMRASPARYTPKSSALPMSLKRKEQPTWMRHAKDYRLSLALHYT